MVFSGIFDGTDPEDAVADVTFHLVPSEAPWLEDALPFVSVNPGGCTTTIGTLRLPRHQTEGTKV